MLCKPKIFQKSYFLKKLTADELDLCWKIMWTSKLILSVLSRQIPLLQMLLMKRWQHGKGLKKFYTKVWTCRKFNNFALGGKYHLTVL